VDGPALRGYNEDPRATILANLQRSQEHLASSDGPALRPITLERGIPLADTGAEAETSSREGDDDDRTNRRAQSSMAARAFVVNRNVQEMVPRLHQWYHITVPTTLASAVGQITQCYVYSNSIAGRYGNPRFGTNLQFDRADPLNGRMPWFSDTQDLIRHDRSVSRPVIPRPGMAMSTDPWSALTTMSNCRYALSEEVQRRARTTTETMKALQLLRLLPPGSETRGGTADDWTLPVPSNADDVEAISQAVIARERECVSFALGAYAEQLVALGFRYVDEDLMRATDPTLWRELSPYTHRG
jgi:hypothetical protein